MKKSKLILVIAGIAIFCAGYLVGILVNYPPVSKTEVAGTFGKAEKFRKVQMTPKDIQLRSDLLKDTANLKDLISSLTYFSVFTERVSNNFDESLIFFIDKGMGLTAEEMKRINALQDYANFIRNNNNTLSKTISMLTDFYLNKSADTSQDVEKTLKDFGAYFRGLNERDSVVTDALESMGQFMDNNAALKARPDDFKQLKSIRDQLLIKGIQLGALTGNSKTVNELVQSVISKDEKLGEIHEIRVGSDYFVKPRADVMKGKLLSYDGKALKFSVTNEKDYSREASDNNSVTLIVQMGSGKANILLPRFSMYEVAQVMNRNQKSGNSSATSGTINLGNTGMSNTGMSNTGMSNTGMSNTGMSNTGMSNTGMSNTGMSNTGMSNTGMSNTDAAGNVHTLGYQDKVGNIVTFSNTATGIGNSNTVNNTAGQ